MSLRSIAICALLGIGVVSGLSTFPAKAQHVVTDYEARKLTLDALTAVPRPVYRPVFRPVVRQAMAMRRIRHAGGVSRAMHASYRHHSSIHGGFRRHR